MHGQCRAKQHKIFFMPRPSPVAQAGGIYIQRSFLAVAVRPQLRRNCSLRTSAAEGSERSLQVSWLAVRWRSSSIRAAKNPSFSLRLRNTTMPLGHCHL